MDKGRAVNKRSKMEGGEVGNRDGICKGEDRGSKIRKISNIKEERVEEEGWIVGGNFNVRTGKEGALENGVEGRERKSSKDKTKNRQEEEMIRWRRDGE